MAITFQYFSPVSLGGTDIRTLAYLPGFLGMGTDQTCTGWPVARWAFSAASRFSLLNLEGKSFQPMIMYFFSNLTHATSGISSRYPRFSLKKLWKFPAKTFPLQVTANTSNRKIIAGFFISLERGKGFNL